jgi:Malate/L-lactate dehydrogenases
MLALKMPKSQKRGLLIKTAFPRRIPNAVSGLLPIAGPKGSGLMMMVDILCGALLGQPCGADVSSMYADLSAGT